MKHEVLSEQAAKVVDAFGELSIPEQQAFFAAVGKCLDLPAAVRDVAHEAANGLADYMDFHGVPLLVA